MLATGIAGLCFGILVAALASITLDFVLSYAMVLTPTSQSYPMWKDLPAPLRASMYLFNVTNVEDVLKNGSKPNLVEVGPYVYEEFHNKTIDSWNDNGTVTYKQVRSWRHVSGNARDTVTILNIPYATLAGMMLQQSPATRGLVNAGMAILNEKLFVTKPVGQILFDGYKDPILSAGEFLSKFKIDMPGLTDKFGFYYGRNNTWYADGVFNINTGANGLGELGTVNTWNFSKQSPFYKVKENNSRIFPIQFRIFCLLGQMRSSPRIG